ncbi:DNA end-binding protein Ku [Rhodoferax ferrireducens]|uniref:Non-homologous end joining protein Ku n=1 Tax=Rhodoferax ferrireducens TaxID=192843 RepID=A0ABU2C786_9BURK|nr:Ku protein [Rhodoferax ferrireducens]MDR7377134.1 DNA end-binding protein Ku [Rhodoferax ferrireducens]
MARSKKPATPAPASPIDKDAGRAPTSTRSLWKGAISFGLVHVPIALYSATDESDLNFKMLDKRSMDPVGYKRINKKSGKEVPADSIVKGIEWEDGRFVLLTPEELEAAYPKTTHTIDIEAFVPIGEIPFVYLEKPYYTAPINRGQKVYALLRESLAASRKVGVAKVVIANKQHLALLMACGPALVLNLLRWGGEIRSWEALQLPPQGVKEAGIKDAEMAMATQLINEMTSSWNGDDFRDSFQLEIMRLVDSKAAAGKFEQVEKIESHEAPVSSNIIDLTELLKRSLSGKSKGAKTAPAKRAATTAAATRPKSIKTSSAAKAAPRNPAVSGKEAA